MSATYDDSPNAGWFYDSSLTPIARPPNAPDKSLSFVVRGSVLCTAALPVGISTRTCLEFGADATKFRDCAHSCPSVVSVDTSPSLFYGANGLNFYHTAVERCYCPGRSTSWSDESSSAPNRSPQTARLFRLPFRPDRGSLASRRLLHGFSPTLHYLLIDLASTERVRWCSKQSPLWASAPKPYQSLLQQVSHLHNSFFLPCSQNAILERCMSDSDSEDEMTPHHSVVAAPRRGPPSFSPPSGSARARGPPVLVEDEMRPPGRGMSSSSSITQAPPTVRHALPPDASQQRHHHSTRPTTSRAPSSDPRFSPTNPSRGPAPQAAPGAGTGSPGQRGTLPPPRAVPPPMPSSSGMAPNPDQSQGSGESAAQGGSSSAARGSGRTQSRRESPSSPQELAEHRLRLKQARAERNRASAERSRIKKKLTSNAVQERARNLERENSALRSRVEHLASVYHSMQRDAEVAFGPSPPLSGQGQRQAPTQSQALPAPPPASLRPPDSQSPR